MPLIHPSDDHPSEVWGVEDPRVTRVDELDAWVIAYTAYGPDRAGGLARDDDRLPLASSGIGVVCPPDDKNAALLPAARR